MQWCNRAVEYVANTKVAGLRPEVLLLAAAHRAHQKKMALLLYFKAYIDDMLHSVRWRLCPRARSSIHACLAFRVCG
jgi:hypothetical protein